MKHTKSLRDTACHPCVRADSFAAATLVLALVLAYLGLGLDVVTSITSATAGVRLVLFAVVVMCVIACLSG